MQFDKRPEADYTFTRRVVVHLSASLRGAGSGCSPTLFVGCRI